MSQAGVRSANWSHELLLDVGGLWQPGRVVFTESMSVWERLREYAASQPGPLPSQEALSWLRRDASSKASDRTVRTHIRGVCWNV